MMREISNSVAKEQAIKLLVGLPAAAVNAGVGTGSVFNIHFKSNKGPTYYLMVFSSWKLIHNDEVVCTWKDREELIAAKLSLIRNLKLSSLDFLGQGDVNLNFQNLFKLKLFSDVGFFEQKEFISDYFIQTEELSIVCFRGIFYEEKI